MNKRLTRIEWRAKVDGGYIGSSLNFDSNPIPYTNADIRRDILVVAEQVILSVQKKINGHHDLDLKLDTANEIYEQRGENPTGDTIVVEPVTPSDQPQAKEEDHAFRRS